MTKMWTGDSSYGKDYLIEFKHRDDQQIVEIFASRGFGETEDQAARGDENTMPIESRDLPLSREDAEGFVEKYFSDLNDKEKSLLVERLSTAAESFRGLVYESR